MSESRPLRIALVGTGLIGGSLVLALRAAGRVASVVGIDSEVAALEGAQARGIIDERGAWGAASLRGYDLVVLSAPVAATVDMIRDLASFGLDTDTVVTDVASVKAPIAAAVHRDLAPTFVPGHPIAGSERSGPDAASPTLFQGRTVVLTPLPSNTATAIARVEDLWRSAGAHVERMTVDIHDQTLAHTSHLPHALAFALVEYLGRIESAEHLAQFTAGGFRDFSRIAASDPVMWRDVFVSNRSYVADGLRGLSELLIEFAEQVEAGDAGAIEALCKRSRTLREQLVSKHGAPE